MDDLPEGFFYEAHHLARVLLGLDDAAAVFSAYQIVNALIDADVIQRRRLRGISFVLSPGVSLEHARATAKAIWLGMQANGWSQIP